MSIENIIRNANVKIREEVYTLNLFNRTISVSVKKIDDQHVIVDGVFIDSNHELILSMTVDIGKSIVTASHGEFHRAPHEDCLCTVNHTGNLVGIDLGRNVRRQVVSAVGGEKGCVHFEELALECVKGVKQANIRLMKLSLPMDEVHPRLYDAMEGTCHHFHTREKQNKNQVAR